MRFIKNTPMCYGPCKPFKCIKKVELTKVSNQNGKMIYNVFFKYFYHCF